MMAFLIRFARRFPPSSETEGKRHGVSLQTRRLLWQLRHMLLALSIGVALFCALQCVALATATRHAVVAARDLDAGLVIATGDVEMVEMPDHDALRHALGCPDDAVGLVTQTRVEKGDILLTTDVSELPQVPEHHTVIDVRLGLGQHSFPIGTVVELRSAQACTGDARASPEGCVVSGHAVVMAQPRLDDTGSTVTQMAMSAVEALQVLGAQEHGTLIAARGAS